MVHLPHVPTDFRSVFGFNGVPTANEQVDENSFFDPEQLLAALDAAELKAFENAYDKSLDLIQWYMRAGGTKALPKTHPGFVAAHLCATRCKHSGLCAHTLSNVHTHSFYFLGSLKPSLATSRTTTRNQWCANPARSGTSLPLIQTRETSRRPRPKTGTNTRTPTSNVCATHIISALCAAAALKPERPAFISIAGRNMTMLCSLPGVSKSHRCLQEHRPRARHGCD